tara:strand:- start:55 stop:582 length:528 start_codon:yes stop_codon:yes gene_type:complete
MTPQLWTQFLTFQEWKLTHPDLTDQEATLLYKAELQLFQNYQDEIRNQTKNRQVRLTGDLLNLSTDISSILTEGGAGFSYKADYIGFEGSFVEPISGFGAFIGSGTHLFKVGDMFSYEETGGTVFATAFNGIYKVLVETNQTQVSTPQQSATLLAIGLNSSFIWEKIAELDGTPV